MGKKKTKQHPLVACVYKLYISLIYEQTDNKSGFKSQCSQPTMVAMFHFFGAASPLLSNPLNGFLGERNIISVIFCFCNEHHGIKC